MVFRFRLLMLLIGFSFLSEKLFSQTSSAGQCTVTITAKSVCAYINDESGADEFSWILSANNGPREFIAIDGEPNCFLVNRRLLTNSVVNNINGKVYLALEAWEDDGGSRNIYNDDEDIYCNDSQTNFLLLNEFEPGVTNSAFKSFCSYTSIFGTKEYLYAADYEFIYSPPIPNQPSVKINGVDYQFGVACSDQTITLLTKDYIKTNDVPNGFIKPEFAR
jgi:hypothetical protein